VRSAGRHALGRLLAIGVACALLAAACGSSSSQTSSSSKTTSTATTTDAPTTGGGTATTPAEILGTQIHSLPQAPAPTGRPPAPSPTATTVDRAYLEAVFADAQQLWRHEFTSAGTTYAPAHLVFFHSTVHSPGCGVVEGAGPFYCGADRGIYLDVGFFDLLARRAGVGRFAQAYVLGHEFGHHVQHLLGIDRRVHAANTADPAGMNARSVRVELQADCLAGVWAHSVYTRGELSLGELEDALRTAQLIGDDFQQRNTGRVVDPGLFTHGSSAQRQHWLTVGFESGKPSDCDTFSQ
jgi:uncharacterized protein